VKWLWLQLLIAVPNGQNSHPFPALTMTHNTAVRRSSAILQQQETPALVPYEYNFQQHIFIWQQRKLVSGSPTSRDLLYKPLVEFFFFFV